MNIQKSHTRTPLIKLVAFLLVLGLTLGNLPATAFAASSSDFEDLVVNYPVDALIKTGGATQYDTGCNTIAAVMPGDKVSFKFEKNSYLLYQKLTDLIHYIGQATGSYLLGNLDAITLENYTAPFSLILSLPEGIILPENYDLSTNVVFTGESGIYTMETPVYSPADHTITIPFKNAVDYATMQDLYDALQQSVLGSATLYSVELLNLEVASNAVGFQSVVADLTGALTTTVIIPGNLVYPSGSDIEVPLHIEYLPEQDSPLSKGDPITTINVVSVSCLVYGATVTAIDRTNDGLLPGAKFQLYNTSTNALVSQNVYTTGDDGTVIVNDLPGSGIFYLKEISAPSGYGLDAEKTYSFTLTKDNPCVNITVKHSRTGYNVTLLKKDADNGAPLKLAMFDLYNSDGSIFQTNMVTDEYGKITVQNVPNGIYYFKETKAPYGYQWDADTKHVITVSGQDTSIIVANKKSATPDLNSSDHISYLNGYTDGTVRPESTITRAETATMLYRLLTAESRDLIFKTQNSFSDVAVTGWYNKAVSSMANGGYLKGYPDGSFGGNRAITRAEFVSMAVRFTNSQGGNVMFKDVPTTSWYYDAVSTAVFHGWVDGYTDGTFRPNQNITRAEAVTILNRVLNRGVKIAGIAGIRTDDKFVTFPDNLVQKWYYYEIIEASNNHTYTGTRDNEIWTSLDTDFSYDKAYYENP